MLFYRAHSQKALHQSATIVNKPKDFRQDCVHIFLLSFFGLLALLQQLHKRRPTLEWQHGVLDGIIKR